MGENGSTLPVPRVTGYPAQFKGWAVALALISGSFRGTERYLAETLPGPTPDNSSIVRWAQRLQPERYSAMQQAKAQALELQDLEIEEAASAALHRAFEADAVDAKNVAIVKGIMADKRIRLQEIRQRSGPAGVAGLLAAMQKMERRTLPDGTVEETQTKLIAAEGDMG